jgi:hypothetical protein
MDVVSFLSSDSCLLCSHLRTLGKIWKDDYEA